MIGGVWVDLDTIMKKLEQSTSGDTICAFLNASETDEPIVNRSTDKDELKRIQEKKFTDCNLFRQPVSQISYTAFFLLWGTANFDTLFPVTANIGSALYAAGNFHPHSDSLFLFLLSFYIAAG